MSDLRFRELKVGEEKFKHKQHDTDASLRIGTRYVFLCIRNANKTFQRLRFNAFLNY